MTRLSLRAGVRVPDSTGDGPADWPGILPQRRRTQSFPRTRRCPPAPVPAYSYSLFDGRRAQWGEEVGVLGDAIVGVVANPLSGRDIRRLVTQASVFPTAEKANMIQRMLTAFGAVGVQRVLLSTDLGGISASVYRAIQRRPPRSRQGQDARWPEVEFLDGQPIRQTAQDTVDAVRRMVTAGTRVIVCLGGDGTARVAASVAGDVPMLALSTGTNNVFPAVREA